MTDVEPETRIGVVGAGAGAAALTYTIDGAVPDASVTVLEKSRGVCGRAATRRRGDVTYDYGANYLKDDDDRVNELVRSELEDGLVETVGPIYVFDRDGRVSEGRDADDHKWSYRTGLTRLAKHLFEATDADVHRRTHVESIARSEGGWRAVDTEGEGWGPFDTLVLNPPAPQTADLIADADWDTQTRDQLLDAVRSVEYRTIWTAVLHYPFELDVPYYGLVNTDKEHPVGWISREECKPGHVPDGESLLIVQANPQWSVERYDDPPEENVAELADHAAEVIGDDRLTDPDWTDHQGWRYALPEAGVERGPLRLAESADLYCVGDWVAGEARLHAAIRSGLDVGERLAYSL